MKKKLLFVIDSLICGGAEKSLVSLLPLLNQEKYEIHLWMLHRGMVFESLLSDNIVIEPEPSYNVYERAKFRIAHICYSILFRLKSLLGKSEHTAETFWKCVGNAYKVPSGTYDIAIAYQQGVPTYMVSTKINAQKRIAWINADIFAAGYDISYNAAFYDQYDALVPVSQNLESVLREKYPQYSEKYHCIYDILNPDLIRRQSQIPVDDFIFNHQHPLIVTTGRLAIAKNHRLAVEAAKILQDRGVEFVWLFVGDGEERPNIESLIKIYNLQKYVILLGERTNPYPYMAQCDVYVQTSSFEGYGLTIAEAKILGKPVVSTNFDVVHDQIKHEHNGLIAEMTPESVADNILRLINDTDLKNRIIANVNKEKNTTYMTEVEKVEKLFDAN